MVLDQESALDFHIVASVVTVIGDTRDTRVPRVLQPADNQRARSGVLVHSECHIVGKIPSIDPFVAGGFGDDCIGSVMNLVTTEQIAESWVSGRAVQLLLGGCTAGR